ncbi:hypothetical protein BV20DRAFT_144504 [Pilatotrama ljubarskyi]|nr:hypothetical protein BV20DRAFT_144504 [Pilatotrama ljubarskyi]
MECPYCELRQHLLTFRVQTQHAAADRDAHIAAAAQKTLTSVVDPARLRRAELKTRKERVQEICDSVNHVRAENEQQNASKPSETPSPPEDACSPSPPPPFYTQPSTPSTSASRPHPASPLPLSRTPHSIQPPAIATVLPLAQHLPVQRVARRSSPSLLTPVTAAFFTSTSPQAARSPFSLTSTPPQSYARPSVLSGPYASGTPRAVSGPSPGSAPYGTQASTRGIDPLARQIDEMQAQLAVLSDTVHSLKCSA